MSSRYENPLLTILGKFGMCWCVHDGQHGRYAQIDHLLDGYTLPSKFALTFITPGTGSKELFHIAIQFQAYPSCRRINFGHCNKRRITTTTLLTCGNLSYCGNELLKVGYSRSYTLLTCGNLSYCGNELLKVGYSRSYKISQERNSSATRWKIVSHVLSDEIIFQIRKSKSFDRMC